ncbi:hypothetical protein SADUNF_Sadunf19G0001900 [Salix dunnii]|uniref:Uncharacterized protein n=1 Tax=Salix dunnii TaxID=1413687 RepID=A0A835J0Z2_9ROSI|nr:hypothetical protein SADUNF_Sadunf19G0001900 [Salix dunnii]
MVPKSDSERLLGKFFDASQYDFDYEQSSLWSPPIPARRVFLAAPAGHTCSFYLTNHSLGRQPHNRNGNQFLLVGVHPFSSDATITNQLHVNDGHHPSLPPPLKTSTPPHTYGSPRYPPPPKRNY